MNFASDNAYGALPQVMEAPSGMMRRTTPLPSIPEVVVWLDGITAALEPEPWLEPE